jgi:Zn-dependent protease
MNIENWIIETILMVPGILFAITIHEYSHGLIAYRLGDPTAKMMGRLTLNPISHMDPVGTLMLLIVHFGWAKPVPIDARNFSNPKRGMLLSSLAGPASNLLSALAFGIIYQLLFGPLTWPPPSAFALVVFYAAFFNIILALFNLIPIPPLDGSHILMGILPDQEARQYAKLEPYGIYILIGIILAGRLVGTSFIWMVLDPFVSFFSGLFLGA